MREQVVVASHNLMDGRRLDGLIGEHVRLHQIEHLGVLCVQENRVVDGTSCARQIGDALGSSFVEIADDARGRLAMVYDGDRFELLEHHVIELPRLERLSRFERLYTSGVQQKVAQLVTFERRGGRRFTVVNFHLDTAGANAHRKKQIGSIATELLSRGVGHRVVACGDTNAFSMRRRRQLEALRAVLGPLADLGAHDPGESPTHYFARQREPKLPHRIGVALGRLGLDAPGRYDVVCTNLEATARGQVVTMDSDHDLVWARVAL